MIQRRTAVGAGRKMLETLVYLNEGDFHILNQFLNILPSLYFILLFSLFFFFVASIFPKTSYDALITQTIPKTEIHFKRFQRPQKVSQGHFFENSSTPQHDLEGEFIEHSLKFVVEEAVTPCPPVSTFATSSLMASSGSVELSQEVGVHIKRSDKEALC